MKDEKSQGGVVFLLSYPDLPLVPLDLRHPNPFWGKGGGVIPRLFTALAFMHKKSLITILFVKTSPSFVKGRGPGGWIRIPESRKKKFPRFYKTNIRRLFPLPNLSFRESLYYGKI
jgi:hypothetical protein